MDQIVDLQYQIDVRTYKRNFTETMKNLWKNMPVAGNSRTRPLSEFFEKNFAHIRYVRIFKELCTLKTDKKEKVIRLQ